MIRFVATTGEGGNHGYEGDFGKEVCCELSGEERERLETLIRKGKSPARRVLKARILLKADVSEAGKGWSDNRIIEALETSPSMVYRTRKAGDHGNRSRSGFWNLRVHKCFLGLLPESIMTDKLTPPAPGPIAQVYRLPRSRGYCVRCPAARRRLGRAYGGRNLLWSK